MNKINKNNINKTNKIKTLRAKEAISKQIIIIICTNLYVKKHERAENFFLPWKIYKWVINTQW